MKMADSSGEGRPVMEYKIESALSVEAMEWMRGVCVNCSLSNPYHFDDSRNLMKRILDNWQEVEP